MTQTLNTASPRADIVGSFLRPQELKDARLRFKNGEIGAEELRALEDRLITELVKEEKAHGIALLTDGELRREYWHLDFMWGFGGVERIELDHGYQFHGEETTHGSIRLTGKITGKGHPFIADYRFMRQFEEPGFTARQTVPAPAQMLAELYRGQNGVRTREVYPDERELIADIAAAYGEFFRELYAEGCRTVQLDDCTWGMIVDDSFWQAMAGKGFTLAGEAEKYLTVNNLAIALCPAGLTVNTHVCRGNYHSCWASQGAYDSVAPYLFARENVSSFYLEFDDERSGSFAPLALIPEDRRVVLGLVTTKSPKLEDKAEVIARIREASRYVPLDRLSLSPQCGFASCEIGNRLTPAEQWAKVDLVRDIAREVWG